MIQQIRYFMKLEATGGIVLLFFAAFAVLWANTLLVSFILIFLNPVIVKLGSLVEINKPLLMWVNDGFMAIFFVIVGLEVKRELLVGAISSYQRAIFPVVGH